MPAPSSLPGQPQGAGVGHQGLPPVSPMWDKVGRVGLHGPGKLIGQLLQMPYYVPGTGRLGGKQMHSLPGLSSLEGEMDMICNLNNHKNRAAGGPTVCQEICTYNHI